MATASYTGFPSTRLPLSPFQIGAVYGAVAPSAPYYYASAAIPFVPTSADNYLPVSVSPNEKNNSSRSIATTPSNRAALLGKAGLFFFTALLLRHVPAPHPKITNTLISPDWKEWAKVGLGIAGMNQIYQAMDWHPPLWLSAMTNVILVNPLVVGFSRRNLVQGVLLAPFVGALVQGSHWLSDKSEKPLQDYLNIPPLATRIFFSAVTMLAGFKVFPRVNNAIPQLDPTAKGAALETGMMTSCVNGCCSSLICVNDAGQLGTMLVRSVQHPGRSDRKDAPTP